MTLNRFDERGYGLVAAAVRIVESPLRLWRTNRRQFRRFLAFSAIDSHTLDDIGLRRSIFVAVRSDDKVRTHLHAGLSRATLRSAKNNRYPIAEA
ncbi:MAG: hypothetical protein RID42_09415 [Alphaproteobacteria bacterium]|jgi:uncharacterized protein YjiS (DUF1127 family)